MRTSIRMALLAVAGTIASPVAPMTGAPSGAAGGAGVALVRRDGGLQPLARLAGDEWQPLAPAAATGAWSLWLFDDPALRDAPFAARTARPATATAAAAGGACLALSGLDAAVLAAAGARPPGVSATASAADAAASAASGAAVPIGIALSGSDVRPDFPVAVVAGSDLGTRLTARAAPAFHRAEDEAVTLEAEELPTGFPRFADRRQRPITWTRIARQGAAQAAAKTYYLEGWKDYQGFRGRTDIGQIRTTGHVFVQMSGARETIDAEVDLSDVDGHQSMFRTPLAVVAWPERAAWLFATRGADGTYLEIIELTTLMRGVPGTGRPRSVWQGPDGCERGTP
jgi:hypothetical protein